MKLYWPLLLLVTTLVFSEVSHAGECCKEEEKKSFLEWLFSEYDDDDDDSGVLPVFANKNEEQTIILAGYDDCVRACVCDCYDKDDCRNACK